VLGRKEAITQPHGAGPAAPTTADPDCVDILVPYAPSRAWAAVLALALVIGGGAAWSWFARVDTQVRLPGVLLAGRGPVVLAAPVAGSVARLLVATGSAVAPG
jgi:multidrug efflux pump subunit AcrA (membrane-fusion protein)